MTRSTFTEYDIKKAFFEVRLEPIYMKGKEGSDIELGSHFAVHDVERSKVLSVVTRNYRLITNEEACERGRQVFREVFGLIDMDEMQCFNIVMPRTRSFCHIDLIHKNSDFDAWKNDSWTPFLRITNSYNRTKLLKFELGFCRWICKNGLIMGSKSVELSYTHSKNEREKIERFAENIGDIKQLEARFIENLVQLKRYHVPKGLMFPLLLKVFDIKLPDPEKGANGYKRITAIKRHTEKLVNQYFSELGENAYSALNVLTDFATRPVGFISPASQVNSLQAQSSSWMEDFIHQIESRSFTFEKYLALQIEEAAKLQKGEEFERAL